MYRPLSNKAVQEIHEGSIEILSQVGIEVANNRLETHFSAMGPGFLKIIE